MRERIKTRDVFGDYISIYHFGQSIADKSTVPLYYENRIPELQLTNENLSEELEQLLEDAALDDEQDQKVRRFLRASITSSPAMNGWKSLRKSLFIISQVGGIGAKA